MPHRFFRSRQEIAVISTVFTDGRQNALSHFPVYFEFCEFTKLCDVVSTWEFWKFLYVFCVHRASFLQFLFVVQELFVILHRQKWPAGGIPWEQAFIDTTPLSSQIRLLFYLYSFINELTKPFFTYPLVIDISRLFLKIITSLASGTDSKYDLIAIANLRTWVRDKKYV